MDYWLGFVMQEPAPLIQIQMFLWADGWMSSDIPRMPVIDYVGFALRVRCIFPMIDYRSASDLKLNSDFR